MSGFQTVLLLLMGFLLWASVGQTQVSTEQPATAAVLEAAEARLELSRAERRQVQRALTAAGFDPGPADGLFGRATREAISKWQASRGEASATGYLDADAAKALLVVGSNAQRARTETQRRHAGAVGESSAAEQKLSSLLQRELSSIAVDENGWTDLHYAAVLNLPELTTAMLDAGAHASPALKSDGELLGDHLKKILQAFGRDSFVKTRRYGQTPLHLAARQNFYDVAQLLISHGAYVNETDVTDGESDWTPLHYAASFGALEIAHLLLDQGADLGAMCKKGRTSLHYAAQKKATEVARLLLRRGADVDAKDNNGNTPLHYSAWYSALKVAHLLLDQGANLDAMSKEGRTSLHYAAQENATEVAQLLLGRGAGVNTRLLANGISVNEESGLGNTPLHTAARNNAFDVAKLLIENGARLNLGDYDRNNALEIAAQNNAFDVAKLLIENGADVIAEENARVTTALHIAVRNNAIDVAKLLIENGAGVNAENRYEGYFTPLHIAAEINASTLAKLLIDNGANVNANDPAP